MKEGKVKESWLPFNSVNLRKFIIVGSHKQYSLPHTHCLVLQKSYSYLHAQSLCCTFSSSKGQNIIENLLDFNIRIWHFQGWSGTKVNKWNWRNPRRSNQAPTHVGRGKVLFKKYLNAIIAYNYWENRL